MVTEHCRIGIVFHQGSQERSKPKAEQLGDRERISWLVAITEYKEKCYIKV